MAYVEVIDILKHARKHKYGVSFFSVYDLSSIQGVIEAAEELKSPIVLTPWNDETIAIGIGVLENICKYFCDNCKIPASFHLDHAADLKVVLKAISIGYRSIMIDNERSSSLDEYINKSKDVIRICHLADCIVEGEVGKTESTWSSRGGGYDSVSVCSDPLDVKKYVEETEVDSVAITIGTRSGAYFEKAKIRFDLIEETKKLVGVPIAIHGASCLDDESLKKCFDMGIDYFKFGSVIRNAFFSKIDEIRKNNPKDMLDIRYLLIPAKNEIKKVAKRLISVLGSEGMALTY
ncbi:MAG: class II fructose-bisphosphate aldolase [Actinobacteria bacterium]|nr:class II fructose-bisphosphate aldolase [Actinomycetota bacterium]